MHDVLTAETVKNLTKPILDKGLFFEYFYQKGGDSSCVYICRFKKGKDYLDWREVSGGDEINIVTFANGEFGFPSLKLLYPKAYKKFRIKHLLRKATMDEKRAFVASLLVAEAESGKPDWFGIKL